MKQNGVSWISSLFVSTQKNEYDTEGRGLFQINILNSICFTVFDSVLNLLY